MAEAGEGNIKVVVRCRPLNTRGIYSYSYKQSITGSNTFHLITLLNDCDLVQSLHGVQSLLFVWKGTPPFLTLQSQEARRHKPCLGDRRKRRRWHSALTRVTGLQEIGTTPNTVLNTLFIMTLGRSCQIMDLLVSMRVFQLVSLLVPCTKFNVLTPILQTDRQVCEH